MQRKIQKGILFRSFLMVEDGQGGLEEGKMRSQEETSSYYATEP